MKHPIRKAIYPGTFDPITLGHLDIILRSLAIVDKLVIAVAYDVVKTPLFSLEQRVDMVHTDIMSVIGKELDTNRVEIIGFKGLLIEFVKSQEANLIIRGLRAVADFEYEFQLFSANYVLDKTIETVFLPAKDSTHFISATIVKEIARLGGNVSNFVSPYVTTKLADKYKMQKHHDL
jgi:pantetheine-phosphate adenylyltransferase